MSKLEHGTAYRYDKGCRCDACKEAHKLKNRRYQRNWLVKGRCVPGLGWPIGPGDPAPRRPPKQRSTQPQEGMT